jgi:undecaprenyl phosphate N,N'-diacetylbacillosamine 1-phosphate transferase
MGYKHIKRILDLVLSAAGLIITFPVLAATALAIYMESGRPILFRQERLGLEGRVFLMYKFRSMQVGAEKEGTGQYSYEGDPRVTRVGKFIRKTSIDELPQFINILKGEMSIIGPRPVLTYHPWPLEQYSTRQRKRFSVRPGVTGLAQINGRKAVQWEDRIKLDVQYAQSMSLTGDIKILLKTIAKVVSMEDNVNVGDTVKDEQAQH